MGYTSLSCPISYAFVRHVSDSSSCVIICYLVIRVVVLREQSRIVHGLHGDFVLMTKVGGVRAPARNLKLSFCDEEGNYSEAAIADEHKTDPKQPITDRREQQRAYFAPRNSMAHGSLIGKEA